MKKFSISIILSACVLSASAVDFPIEGGERSFIDGDVLNTFRASDKLVVTDATTVHALFVAGGGGGGTGVGGGGGGGGVVEIKELTLQPGTYDVIVGVGGAGAPTSRYTGVNGGDSSITDVDGAAVHELLPALGGGGGGSWDNRVGASGGSGGGSAGGAVPGQGIALQGYAGGKGGDRSAGGGGGAGGAGGIGDPAGSGVAKEPIAVGGPGVACSITGIEIRYGGGGGGGGGDSGACPGSKGTDGGGDGTPYNSCLPAGDGVDGLGGGGGGSGWCNGSIPGLKNGGSGGDGVVILRYSYDFSQIAEPICYINSADPIVGGGIVDLDVVSLGMNASSLEIFVEAIPENGDTAITKSLCIVNAACSNELIIDDLAPNAFYTIRIKAVNDKGFIFQSEPMALFTLARYGIFDGGDEFIYLPGKNVHVFTNSATITVNRNVYAEVLVVGGGGGGGKSVGGGGAGGAVIYKETYAITNGVYDVIVGAGGLGAGNNCSFGLNGGESSFAGIVAMGGGGGASWEGCGLPGANGGGASGYRIGGFATSVNGFNGGRAGSRSSGGGAGAGGPGGDGDTAESGYAKEPLAVGGPGVACSITGVEVRYGGGGGGGGGDSGACPASKGTDGGGDGSPYAAKEAPGNGVDGLGGGGGGSGFNGNSPVMFNGGNGGSGVVIIAYPVPPVGLSIIIR